MVNLTVDYNNTFGKAVEEAGSYNVKIMDSSTAKQTKKGKEMAVLNYEVLDGKYAGAAIRYHNIVWDDSTEEALSLSIKRLNTLLSWSILWCWRGGHNNPLLSCSFLWCCCGGHKNPLLVAAYAVATFNRS